jgi:hypothetical protein
MTENKKEKTKAKFYSQVDLLNQRTESPTEQYLY